MRCNAWWDVSGGAGPEAGGLGGWHPALSRQAHAWLGSEHWALSLIEGPQTVVFWLRLLGCAAGRQHACSHSSLPGLWQKDAKHPN